jgi:hypothetical protein
MNASFSRFAAALSLLLAAALVTSTFADPLPLRDRLKFSQLPMDNTPIGPVPSVPYWGHDELSTAYAPLTGTPSAAYRGTFMADDFADKISSPVLHVKWWGSYHNNFQNSQIPVTKFLVAFEADQPAIPGTFSYPIPPIHSQIVTLGALSPGSGTYTEKLISGGGQPLNEHLYEYNAELAIPFDQKADTVYWLKIVALVDVPAAIDPTDPNAPVPRWGWHNRDYTLQNTTASMLVSPGEQQVGSINGSPIWHFQDNAVTGAVDVFTGVDAQGLPVVSQVIQHLPTFQPTHYIDGVDGPAGIGNFSKDLAFELYTTQVPEPGTCLTLLIGCVGLLAAVRGNRD